MTPPLKLKEHNHFPFKLYDMLEYAADSEYSSAVSWVADGGAFAIHDKDTFLNHIVPLFFKQTKFRSFTRQLNLWGFTRLSDNRGSTRGAWKHEHLVRGNIERLSLIERREIKNIKPKIEGHEPKDNKPENRHAASTAQSKRSVFRNISIEPSTTDYLSKIFEEKVLQSVSKENVFAPAIINNPLNTFVQPLVPNRQFQPWFQSQTIVSPFTLPHSTTVLPPALSFPAITQNSLNYSNMQTSQPKPPSSNGNSMATYQHTMQPTTMASTNDDDILDVLSAFFESDESTQTDDLLSLNEISEDFMNPFEF